MSQGDDGASERPASPKMPGGAPRPKPSVPGAAPPRPGTPARANPPPPVPTRAKEPPPPPPPPREDNPFLLPESSSKIDAGWPALEDATDSLEPASTDAPPFAPAAASAPSPPPPMAPPVEPPKPAGDAEPPKPQSVGELESAPPFKPRSRGKVLAIMFLAVVVLGGAGFAYQSQEAARAARMRAAAPQTAQTTAEPVVTSEPPPPPTHTADPPPSASAAEKKPATGAGGAAPAVSIDPASRAFLDGTPLPPGRKIVVDGRVVGTSPRKVAVRCGVRRIQIGDQPPENIDFPCGGEVTFTE